MSSTLSKKELGVVQAVLDRFNKQRLPRLLKMKKRVDDGETLTDSDMTLLKEAIKEARGGEAFAEKHPELKSLVDLANELYAHITEKALENEKSKQA